MLAQASTAPALEGRATGALMIIRRREGRMDRRSDLTTGTQARPDETFIAISLGWERPRPTDARDDEEPSPQWFWKTAS